MASCDLWYLRSGGDWGGGSGPAKSCVLLCLQALGCLLYACFILGRLCVPVFANMSREPFSTRALLLSILHATGPGKHIIMVAKVCAPPWGTLVRESVTLSLSPLLLPLLSVFITRIFLKPGNIAPPSHTSLSSLGLALLPG